MQRLAALRRYVYDLWSTRRLSQNDMIDENRTPPGISLPPLTAEMIAEFGHTDLLDYESAVFGWSQIAVDFVCMLNSIAHHRTPTEPE